MRTMTQRDKAYQAVHDAARKTDPLLDAWLKVPRGSDGELWDDVSAQTLRALGREVDAASIRMMSSHILYTLDQIRGQAQGEPAVLEDLVTGIYSSYDQHVLPTPEQYLAEDAGENEVIVEDMVRELRRDEHQDALRELVALAMPVVLRHYA